MRAWICVLFVSFSVAACGDDSPSGSDAGPPDAARDAGRPDAGDVCTTNAECDDGVFCNGAEICQPMSVGADARGCVASPTPACGMGRICTEGRRACETDCGGMTDADGDGHRAAECAGDDCDDGDAMRFPGNDEVCDGADHDEDCDAETFGSRDADRDGFVDAACCNDGPMGARACGLDCNDHVAAVHPSQVEVCNGRDDDCNGAVDDGVLVAGFADEDHDLHGDPDHAVMACPFAASFSVLGDDCEDTSVAVHAAQVEICDAVDNDCDGMVDDRAQPVTWYADLDGDGFGNARSGTQVSCTPVPGYSLLATDCDDARMGIHPGAAEQCNGLDDDCNGLADFAVAPGDWEDDDGDGALDARCPRVGTDCDDDDANVQAGAPEICDGVDDDCDGMVDEGAAPVSWYPDLDGDGWGDMTAPGITSCEPVAGRVTRRGDPDDSSPSIHGNAVDACNGVDDDGDGDTDEDAPRAAYYADSDGDGVGAGTPTLACVPPPGLVTLPGDCDDTRATVRPGLVELCGNGRDDDCDGRVDDAPLVTTWPDADGDGHGEAGSAPRTGCTPGPGYASSSDDCDDTDPTVHPGGTETCNGLDDDCDGTVDGAAAAAGCAFSHATATCTAGACTIASCATSYGNCDRVAFNGCETDTRTSRAHCGTCDRACGVGDACVGGACVASPIVQVVGGTYYACARRSTGGVVCWGTNGSGQLGNGSTASSLVPVPAAVSDAIDVAAGYDHACAVRRGGTVVCWGTNGSGQLGDGSTATRLLPVTVVGVTDAVDVSAGQYFTCAVRATGAVACWGWNAHGVLGADPGTLGSSPVPVVVPGVTDAVAIATSVHSACVLRSTGAVACWGYGGYGELGDGLGASSPTPVSPLGVAGASVVSGNPTTYSFCAVLSTGEVRCWGLGDYGQLGYGGGGSALSPVAPTGIFDAIDVAVARYTGCVLRARGTVTCFGYGIRGELGVGLGAPQTFVPGPDIPGLTGVASLGAGWDTLYARLSTGGVRAWGDNPYGELGDGTTTTAGTPTAVSSLP